MKKYWIYVFTALLIVFLGVTFTAFSISDKPEEQAGKGPIVVASKIDTEGALLGQMIIHMLEANGFDAVDRTEFGPTDVIRKAIINGEIDIYPEYTG
ncbi:MAG: ABC transporter substrate-binding protein, partial [Spirochaetes bacterium]|nr:ABC transporter substrate-binding protein [Spirochaetota bacterium]